MATGILSTVQPAPLDPAKTVTGGELPAPNATPANVASVPPPAAIAPRTITEQETVAGQMNKLLSADSTYLQSARNRGMEQANQRGLINSSLAAGTAERAAIDAAAPIAQQDANTYATAGQSAQSANQDMQVTGYKSLLDSAQQAENFGYRTQENQQNIEANTALQRERLTSEQSMQQQAEQAQLQRQSQAEAAALQQQTQQQQATLQLQTQLKQMDIDLDLERMEATARDGLTSAVSPIIQQVQAEISQIQRTADEVMGPTEKAIAIEQLRASMVTDIQTISTLYGYELDWPVLEAYTSTRGTRTDPTSVQADPIIGRSGSATANPQTQIGGQYTQLSAAERADRH